jgi:tRNA (mo5U34)-methyltransferase
MKNDSSETAAELIPQLDMRRTERLRPDQRAVMDKLLRDEIPRRKWYHRIDLGNGIVTPGFAWESIWNNTRKARASLDYRGRSVLDLGSWDGLWAFEAEALGAELVVATDCMNTWQNDIHQGMDNLLLIREALYSRVVPLWNVSPYRLHDRLDGLLYSHPLVRDGGFDIVQHLGLFYHLRDPMLSLAQSRSVIREGGTLLVETAFDPSDSATMRFNAPDSFYPSVMTWWAPTLVCLREMLRLSFFELDQQSVALGDQHGSVARVAFRAVAVRPGDSKEDRYILDPAYGHGFGKLR